MLWVVVLLGCSAPAQDSVPAAFFQSPAVRLGEYVLWHDPGAVESLDFRHGIGGPELTPEPPFTFLSEDPSGTTPKISVSDGKGRKWVVKFGDEAGPDVFCTRLAWALGYYVEPAYFLDGGVIEGAPAGKYVDASGRFDGGRFQLRSREPRFFRAADWSWTDNPFLGTPELNGLKILMMLLSNWDDKDSRDTEKRGSNTAIYRFNNLYFYFIDDWGGAMGGWGKYFTRSKWDAAKFRRQSAGFVKLENGNMRWGYVGQHTGLMTRDIRFSDIAWLLHYLGRVTDGQIRAGLVASGASEAETRDFTQGLRMRIRELHELVSSNTTTSRE